MKKVQLFLLLIAVYVGSGNARPQESARSFLLVSLNAERQVAVVDPRTQTVLTKLPSPAGPHEIAVARDSATAFVSDTGAGPGGAPGDSILVMDLKTRSPRATFKTCERPHDSRVSKDGRLLWVACAPMKAVLELDATTGSVVKTWNTNLLGGWFVEVTPDERKLYVPHLEEKALCVIDRTTGQVRTIISGTTQFGVTVSPNGREVWVSDADENKLSVIDTSNDRVIATISLGESVKGQLKLFTFAIHTWWTACSRREQVKIQRRGCRTSCDSLER